MFTPIFSSSGKLKKSPPFYGQSEHREILGIYSLTFPKTFHVHLLNLSAYSESALWLSFEAGAL